MGQRGKIIAEIEREVGRLENRPGLCLFSCPPHGLGPAAS